MGTRRSTMPSMLPVTIISFLPGMPFQTQKEQLQQGSVFFQAQSWQLLPKGSPLCNQPGHFRGPVMASPRPNSAENAHSLAGPGLRMHAVCFLLLLLFFKLSEILERI